MICITVFCTSSSAVAKRPRDASCLSVVSFNSTKRPVESFIVSYRLQIYHCMQLNALFCCLWRNVKASCHMHFVVFSRNQHRHLLPAMCHNLRDSGRGPPATLDNTWHVAALTAGTKARYRLRIAISAYPTCIRRPVRGGGGSRRSIAMPFGKVKLEWCGYPMVKKFRKYVYSF